MKTTFKFLLTCACALAAHSAMAECAYTLSDISGAQGETTNLSIGIDNGDVQVVTVQFDLVLPEGVTIKTGTDDEPIVNLTERADGGQTATCGQLANGNYRFIAYSMKNRPLAGSEGDIFIVPIELNCAPGQYQAEIINATITNGDLEEETCLGATASITVTEAEEIRYTDNQIYAKDIEVIYGSNAKLEIYYNSLSDLYEYSAQITLPDAVSASDLEWGSAVEVQNFTNDWTFDEPVIKIKGEYGGGRRDLPAEAGNHLLATVDITTMHLPEGTYQITIDNQFLSNDDDDYNPEPYVVNLVVMKTSAVKKLDATKFGVIPAAGAIHVSGAEANAAVIVTEPAGRCIYRGTADANGAIVIPTAHKGILIVKAGTNVAKLILK